MTRNKKKNDKFFVKSDIEVHLEEVLEKTTLKEKISIGEIFSHLKGRGYPFMVFLLTLPFCQPIQIPGFSTPFGIIIAFIGLRIAFGKRLWWSRRILAKELSSKMIEKIIKGSLWLIKKLKRFIHPRWAFLCSSWAHLFNGLLIAVLGVILALPLPIPFSNLLAGWALLFLSLGMIEDDGVMIFLGYLLAVFASSFLYILVKKTFEWLFYLGNYVKGNHA